METITIRQSCKCLLTAICAGLLLTGSQPARAQRSAPGAPKANGHFYEFNGAWLRERDPYTYSTPTYLFLNTLPAGMSWVSRPMHWESTIYQPGQFAFVGKNSTGWQMLMTWCPTLPGRWTNYGSPPLVQVASAPSKVMYGNRVYVVGTDGKLWEKFLNSSPWYNFGHPLGHPLRAAPPCVLSDGKMFVVTVGGQVIQMYWNSSNNTWNFYNHGYPYKTAFKTVKAIGVGAGMNTGKVFINCDDGSLRQLYYNGSSWGFYNHGQPTSNYFVDCVPEAIRDGKLFVTASFMNSSYYRALFQLYWNGSTWVWASHGSPSNQLKAGVSICPNIDRIFIRDNTDSPWEVFWNSGWQWQAH